MLSRKTYRLPGEARRVIVETLKARTPAPHVVEAVAAPLTPAEQAQREIWRARWRASAPREQRLLSLSVRTYPNGLSLLEWFAPAPDGSLETYQAWSRTDFRSLWLVGDMEVNGTRYFVFPTIFAATRWDKQLPWTGPLDFAGNSPGFTLIKGDPANLKGLEAITELHALYRLKGAGLNLQSDTLRTAQELEAARLKALPPEPPQDIIIRHWPVKTNVPPATALPAVPGPELEQETGSVSDPRTSVR